MLMKIGLRMKLLLTGTVLIILWMLAAVAHLTYRLLPIYWLEGEIYFTLLGLGIALVVYGVGGARLSKWLSIFTAMSIISLYILHHTYPPGFPPTLIGYFTYSSFPFTLAFWLIKKKSWWKIASILAIVFSVFSIQALAFQISYWTSSGIYDLPERDALNEKHGWALCGELALDPKKDYQAVEWSERFRGNESFACYFKIRLPEGSRPVYASYHLETSVHRESIPPGGEVVGFYHWSGMRFSLDEMKNNPPTPYSYYEPTNTIGSAGFSGELGKDTYIIYRVDVYISYKPSRLLPEYYSTEVVTVASFKFEVRMLWEV